MKLTLKNIGKIGEASIDMNGITVIAGENDTGKSTVGRTLFVISNSFYHIEQKIKTERIQNAEYLISMMCQSLTKRNEYRGIFGEIAQAIINNREIYKDKAEVLKEFVVHTILQEDASFEQYVNDVGIDEFISQIRMGLNISDIDIFKFVLEKNLNTEFNGQINNIFLNDTGEIALSIKEQKIRVAIEDNHVEHVEGKVDFHTEIVYIDDPFVLDEARYYFRPDGNYFDHRGYLKIKLFDENRVNIIDEIVVNKKLEKIYDKLSEVCSGNIVRVNRSRLGYQKKNADKVIAAKNLSTGLKTFAILKTLLQNGTIGYHGIIILDEPETHLHPEWQLLFAELIVLIQKEFGMHILLNTHSPYFLSAVEVYTAKYGVADRCKYYLASSESDISFIEDVTGNIEKIYSKLAKPLQKLENEGYRL